VYTCRPTNFLFLFFIIIIIAHALSSLRGLWIGPGLVGLLLLGR
jgi:hypothetical protein